MKLRTFLLAVLLSTNLFATQWMSSYEDAQKMAVATNKLILVDFWADWCMPCKRMDMDTWSTEEIKNVMSNFVPLKINIDDNRDISSKYAANRIPYIIIIDATGEIVYSESGYKDKESMLKVLKDYSVNTNVFQSDFSNFLNNEDASTSLSIAEKYFDYSIYVKESAKNDFLKTGYVYLKKTKKISSKKEYKEKYEQRVALLAGPYKDLIRGKFEKVIKNMTEKFDENTIKQENKALFYFLNFTAYNKLNDKENAKVWYNKLKVEENHKVYLLKSRKI